MSRPDHAALTNAPHDHAHRHGHDHGEAHPQGGKHAPASGHDHCGAPAAGRPGFVAPASLLLAGGGARFGIVIAALFCLWLAIFWALRP